MEDNEALEFDTIDDPKLEQALRAARMDPQAVVLSLWPSAIPIVESDNSNTQPKDEEETTTASQIQVGRTYLHECGYTILYETSIDIPREVATLFVLAMYWGEAWLRTNCWYPEQPLEDLGIGLRKPTGAWPGATWKTELCFRQQQQQQETAAHTTPANAKARTMRMHVFVATTSIHDPNPETNTNKNSRNNRGVLWSKKYAIRDTMADNTGHAGNSCMHLTDDQATILQHPPARTSSSTAGNNSMDCNASYAVACARCLLNPYALEFLQHQGSKNSTTTTEEYLQSPDFLETFENFCRWLGDRTYEDIVEKKIRREDDVTTHKNNRKTQWNRPPPF